jgi:hypothetical protein
MGIYFHSLFFYVKGCRKMKLSIIFLFFSIFLNGCTNNPVKITGEPQKTITLEEAFKSIGKSLRILDEETGDKMFGFAASEIIVTFNISSKAVDNSGINISTPILAGSMPTSTPTNYVTSTTKKGVTSGSNTILAGNSLSSHSTVNGARANQIFVKFESILKLIKPLSMEQIKLLREMGYFDKAKTPEKLHEMVFNGASMTVNTREKK